MEIKKLSGYTLEDQRLLGGFGYTSTYKYNVKREIIDENTIIKIELIDLSYYTNDDVEDGEVAFFMRKKLM